MFARTSVEVRPEASAGSQQLLWSRFAETGDLRQFCAAWLALQCQMLEGTLRAVLVLGPPDTGPFVANAFWPPDQVASELLAEVADQALQARTAMRVHGDRSSGVAYPIVVAGHLHGLVALETELRSDEALQPFMRQLQWGVQGLEAALLREQAHQDQVTRERLMSVLDLVASAMTEQKFAAAAHALVTDLAIRLDCDRVSLGFQEKQRAHVVAVSHSAQIGKRMNLIRAIESAMDEAIDQKSLVQMPAGEQILVVRDHAALARQHGNDCILTVPFQTLESISGALTFERSGKRIFAVDEVELCQAVVALCSRILDEKRLNDRLIVARLKDVAIEQVQRFFGARYFGRKLAATLLMLAAVFFSFASSHYWVGANASLEGAVRRVLVAPYDGYVSSATYRAGDLVKFNTVLASLDQRDLQLEYLRWASQAEQYAQQFQDARAKSDRVQANIAQSQADQAKAQMDLLAEHLTRANITTPIDGVVVSGDLSQSLGSAVKRGQTLFEVSPLNSYRVILEVDESDIAGVRETQTGKLLLTSLPGVEFPLVIYRVTPVTHSREGRSFFRVEATVLKPSPLLRPGMEGVGKIDVGSRKLFWQWSHKFFDWLKLSIWSWL